MTLRLRFLGIEILTLSVELPEPAEQPAPPRPPHKRLAAWLAARELAIMAAGR